MSFPHAQFLTSALKAEDYPRHDRREVAIAGRSNVGKSSLINALVPMNRLAFVSKKPGRTQTINFFALDDRLCLVDLPGYGYAKVPRNVKDAWGPAIESFLRDREQLRAVVLLIDGRHGPTSDDLQLWEWLNETNRSALPVATKWDKIKKAERPRRLQEMQRVLGREPLPFSSVTKEGRDPFIGFLKSAAV